MMVVVHLLHRQCSSGLQAVASVAAAIKTGFYEIGLAGGVETMSTNPMAWDGGINPKIAENPQAQDCLLPMGE
jgi:acetyl-CoA acyltransferase 1